MLLLSMIKINEIKTCLWAKTEKRYKTYQLKNMKKLNRQKARREDKSRIN